jgi:RHS repeat-associated protein
MEYENEGSLGSNPDNSGTVQNQGFTYRYVYGLNRLSVKIFGINTTAGNIVVDNTIKLYLHNDRLGSTRYATSDVTDPYVTGGNKGNNSDPILAYTDYDEWGNQSQKQVLKIGDREIDVIKSYATYDYDPVLGQYYGKARMYNAGDKRFGAVDPIRSGLNWYAYCNDNPIIFIDPLGLIELPLRDMVKDTYGTDGGLKWDPIKKTATINGASFSSCFGNAYIDSNGRMIVDSAVFSRAIGLSNRFGSYNPDVTKELALKALRSEYANTQFAIGNPNGLVMIPREYYFLDYNGNTIDLWMDQYTMHVSMISGDAKMYLLSNPSLSLTNAYDLSDWLKGVYSLQYDRSYGVGTEAIAVELIGHAVPDYLISISPDWAQERLQTIKNHSEVADIGEGTHELFVERVLWDTLGPAVYSTKNVFDSVKDAFQNMQQFVPFV